MFWKPTLPLGALGALTLMCATLSATARAADEAAPKEQPQAPPAAAPGTSQTAPAPSQTAPTYQSRFLNQPVSQDALFFGYWGSHTAGSPVGVGRYQDLAPSPFFSVDGIHSDGWRTLNYTLNGMDKETTAINVNFYRPDHEINFDYQRFPHNLGHENLGEFPNFTSNSATVPLAAQFRRQDANPGEDYAIRVQELKANYKWKVSDGFKVRLDVWGMYKEGERDARAMMECYGHPDGLVPNGFVNRNCHVLDQMQHIDWQTTEVKPVVEFNLGWLVVEYSRPMRVFSASDQVVSRYYDSRSSATGLPTARDEFGDPRFMEYGVVPDNFTQIDQIKMSGELNDCNKIYSFLFAGTTRKRSDISPPIASPSSGPAVLPPGQPPFSPFPLPPSDERISTRRFDGADVRWTNTRIENVTITTYGRIVEERNEAAAFVIPGEETRPVTPTNPTGTIEDDPTGIVPINYRRAQLGSRFLWRPFGGGFGLGGLALNGNYEYSVIHRENLAVGTGNDDPPFNHGELIEADTHTDMFSFGPSVRWSPQLDTYVRYKWSSTQSPLFATNSHEDADYRALALNSALPTHDNLIEIGGTWMPSECFMLNAWFGIDTQNQHFGQALVANNTGATVVPLNVPQGFDSQSYPFGINGFYRATEKWTVSGGAAYYTNFIDQDVAFGAGLDHTFTPYGLLQNRWEYGSRISVFNLGSTYDINCNVRLVGGAEYVKGIQSADLIAGDPRFPNLTSTLATIPGFFRQDVITTRLTAGIDWRMSKRWTSYVRYVLYDYNDKADNQRIATSTLPVTGLPISGTSNLFLGGMSATF